MSQSAELIQNTELHALWEGYRHFHNDGPLLDYIRNHPEVKVVCTHSYPYLHRIADVILDGQTFRVTRCVRCHDRLAITPIESTHGRPDEPGVPYDWQNETLKNWVESEEKNPAKGPIDWSRLTESSTQHDSVGTQANDLAKKLFEKHGPS